jgi:ubiquinone/menaquinone biosynthesis C-methylase UbiE
MPTPNLDKVRDLMQGYWRSAILFTAVHFSIFEWIGKKGLGPGIVARKARISERGATILLDALAALGVLRKSGGRYYNTSLSSQFLIPGASLYVGDSIKHYKNLWKLWARLDEAVATGRGVRAQMGRRSERETVNFILAMENTARRRAKQVLGLVGASDVRKMLDVGGGPATYSIAFASKNKKLQATVIDLRIPLRVARDKVKEAKLQDRIRLVEGDYFEVDFGTGYDLVLLSNVLHSMSPGRARLIISRAYSSLAPGGRVVVHDFLPNDDRKGPMWPLIFAVNMLVATESGNTYTYEEICAWLRGSGFQEMRLLKVEDSSALVTARKPGRRIPRTPRGKTRK